MVKKKLTWDEKVKIKEAYEIKLNTAYGKKLTKIQKRINAADARYKKLEAQRKKVEDEGHAKWLNYLQKWKNMK